mmetsp:Transcript_26771/g.41039  ORF Transcript_26771/g.41039 Transcript_26771/m.41039 type:complete len:267 (+) Transcript_26771:1880-2680(+)
MSLRVANSPTWHTMSSVSKIRIASICTGVFANFIHYVKHTTSTRHSHVIECSALATIRNLSSRTFGLNSVHVKSLGVYFRILFVAPFIFSQGLWIVSSLAFRMPNAINVVFSRSIFWVCRPVTIFSIAFTFTASLLLLLWFFPLNAAISRDCYHRSALMVKKHSGASIAFSLATVTVLVAREMNDSVRVIFAISSMKRIPGWSDFRASYFLRVVGSLQVSIPFLSVVRTLYFRTNHRTKRAVRVKQCSGRSLLWCVVPIKRCLALS